jgi:hypothetical protein
MAPGFDTDLDMFLGKTENCDEENVTGDGGDKCDGCEKCAFVVPVYEVSTNATHFPVDKTELIDFVHSNMSIEFHKVSDGRDPRDAKASNVSDAY